MALNLRKPILYLITRGATSEATTPDSEEFRQILEQVSAAVGAGIQLIQIREKQLTAHVLFELATAAVALAQGSSTLVLINDRADIANAAGAAGVHLTTHSLEPAVIRRTFGRKFLIGVSTHSVLEVHEAYSGGADFAVLGPIFSTPSKQKYGAPLGPEKLTEAGRESPTFPVIALGGITLDNMNECLAAGAWGVAAINLFGDSNKIAKTVEMLKTRKEQFRSQNNV